MHTVYNVWYTRYRFMAIRPHLKSKIGLFQDCPCSVLLQSLDPRSLLIRLSTAYLRFWIIAFLADLWPLILALNLIFQNFHH